MRRFALLSLFSSALFIACAAATEDPSPSTSSNTDAGGSKKDGATSSASDGASSTDAPSSTDTGTTTDDAATADDATVDTDAAAVDAADDVAVIDAAADVEIDAGVVDSGTDATADAAADAGDGGCTPPNGNFAFCGTATATSTYSGYPASLVNDGVLLNSSWYLAAGSCTVDAGVGSCGTTNSVTVTLDQTRTIGRVKLFGNRGSYALGYDTLTARIQLLSAANAVLATADVTLSRGAEPNGDVDHAFPSAVSLVKKVRVLVLTGESDEPGLAEIEAYAN